MLQFKRVPKDLPGISLQVRVVLLLVQGLTGFLHVKKTFVKKIRKFYRNISVVD